MISPERLKRYNDFVDPDKTGSTYDPRQGLERLMGVLSPDPKGILLAAMGFDWYGTYSQLQSAVFRWFEELGLSEDIWPITHGPTWEYCERIDKHGEIIDGSLVRLGAVVKKAEDPSQTLYSRSIAGAELGVPLVQQAVRFVSKAEEYTSHKFDSMWRIISSVNSTTDKRRPIGVWQVVDFLVHNPGKHRQIDLHNETHISQRRLGLILPSLGNCGIIDYISPETEVEGHAGRGWAVYTLVDQSVIDLDPNNIYQAIRGIRRNFHHPTYLTQVTDYIKEYLNSEYESRKLADKLGIAQAEVSRILSLLADLKLLQRPDPGFKGGKKVSSASANDLTHLFYDLVCAPAKYVADTLSPLPLEPWDRSKVALYLENYNEERSQAGSQAGEEGRGLLLYILSQNQGEMKLSHIADLYNNQAERKLQTDSVGKQLKKLIKLGQAEQPKPGYYRKASN